jgi:RNA polymerase sigma factor for flagellar operon FliA
MGKTLHVPRSVLRQARALRVLAAESEHLAHLAEGQKINSAPDPKEAAVGALSEVLSRVATAYTMSLLADPTSTPEDKVAQGQSVEVMRAAALLLPERERRLIQEHYFGDRNLDDIGKELGLSKSWTSRLHAKALDHLRVLMVGDEGDEDATH